MDISKFIKENNNPYNDSLDTKIERVEELVNNNQISSKLGVAIISYLIKKDVSDLIKYNLTHILQGNRNKWIMFNYSRKQTNYI